MDRSLVFLDTETAAFRGAPHLVELAAVRVECGEVVDHYASLVCPQVPVEDEATGIHGLTETELRAAPEAAEVLGAFLDWLGDDWLVAHNARADASVLGYELGRARLAGNDNLVLDSLPLARQAFPGAQDHRLATLVELLDIDVEQLHRALDDAAAAAQVFDLAIVELGGWQDLTEAELIKRCGTPVTLASSIPPAPRASRRIRPLAAATAEGGEVKLAYGEDGQTPMHLTVSPRFLFRHKKRDYLEAVCSSSGLLKTYRLDRVRAVERLDARAS